MCVGGLVQLWRECVPSASNFEELSTFQALLYISARTVALACLFMKRQATYVPLESCRFKCQWHFQGANIISSDWIVKAFQLKYSQVKLIRCVPVYTELQASDLVCTQNSWTQKQIGTEQETCSHLPNYYHALSNNIKKRLNTEIWQTSTDCLLTWNTYLLTHYMQHSPSSEANRFAARQVILLV